MLPESEGWRREGYAPSRALGSGRVGPGTGPHGSGGIVSKVAGRAPKRALHPVTNLSVAPIQGLARDAGEDIRHEVTARGRDIGVKILKADRDVPDRASRGL